MATKAQILNILANESEPLHRNRLAEKLGENTYRSFQSQLDRFEKQGLIEGTPDHEYKITEVGMKELSAESLVTEETDEEKLGTTEYQRFIHLGKITGISPPELIKQTADHIWNGGDFRDLDWIAKAFIEMGIRKDLRERWFHSWRSSLHQGVSPIALALLETDDESKSKAKSKVEGKGGRSYILDVDDKVVFVGEGLGDMWYEDAKELALVRAGRGKQSTSQTPTPGSFAEEVGKIFTTFKEVMGEKAQGKSYMVRQGEEGIQVEEVDQGRPMVINYPQGDNKQKPAYFVKSDGEVQEVQPGQPIIIKQPAPVQPVTGDHFLIDKTTGQVTQVQPGQPIIIQAAPLQQPYPYTPIQMRDQAGNPLILDLTTFIKLEEHKDKRHRDQESHELKIDIAKGFKDMLSKASTALGHVAEEK